MSNFYVYYDEETGALGSISKIELDDESGPFIRIPEEEALKFLTAEYVSANFIVADDELVDTTKDNNLEYSNNNFYLIPEGKGGGDITLQYSDGVLSITLKETLIARNFFVTEKDDPTSLRKIILSDDNTKFIKDTVGDYPFSVWTNRSDNAKITLEVLDGTYTE